MNDLGSAFSTAFGLVATADPAVAQIVLLSLRVSLTAVAVLSLVGLAALADRPARRLSGGEQQRLALARAAALHTEVLFLDEPCANLDPAATKAVEEIAAALAARVTKIVMTRHDLGQARRLAAKVVFLHRGRVAEHAPAESFFALPETPEAAAFLRGELVW